MDCEVSRGGAPLACEVSRGGASVEKANVGTKIKACIVEIKSYIVLNSPEGRAFLGLELPPTEVETALTDS